jgi:hypothetical protein
MLPSTTTGAPENPAQWRERWRRVFACTELADRPRAEQAITELYGLAGVPAPAIVWCDSPLGALFSMVGALDPSPWIRQDLATETWTNLHGIPPRDIFSRAAAVSYPGPLPPPLRFPPGLRIPCHMRFLGCWGAMVNPADPMPPWAEAVRMLRTALISWAWAHRSRSLNMYALLLREWDQDSWFFGQHDAALFGRHQWWRDVLHAACDELQSRMLDAWIEVAESCGWGSPRHEQCILCERPEQMVLNPQGLLHNPQGPAIRFRDNSAVWALHGVAVPWWLVATPGSEIHPRRFFELDNMQLRREFARKVGLERICSVLKAKCMDRHGDYELLTLEVGAGRRRPFLKMLNPSTGTWHVEGVHPSCTTVAAALAWRNGTRVPPAMLT